MTHQSLLNHYPILGKAFIIYISSVILGLSTGTIKLKVEP